MAIPHRATPNTGINKGKVGRIARVELEFPGSSKRHPFSVASLDFADSPIVTVTGHWYMHVDGRLVEDGTVLTDQADVDDVFTIGNDVWVAIPTGFRRRHANRTWGPVTGTDPRP